MRLVRERTMEALPITAVRGMVIWCAGCGYALDHLIPLGIVEPKGAVSVQGARAVHEPRLWLIGYGEWTGDASATIIGVGRYARSTVAEVAATLQSER